MLNVILLTIIASFAIVLLSAPLFIPVLRRLKFGQSIRDEGPKSHQKKKGTPTMGGVIILLGISLTTFKFANHTYEFYLLVLVTLGYGLIGFLDDFIKIYFKRNLGLTAKQKLLGQMIIAAIFCYFLYNIGHSTEVYIPGSVYGFDLGWLYFPFVVIMLVGASNAVNLTDGLDGLLSGTAAIAFGAYALLAARYSEPDIAIFSAAVVGAVLGFLLYNAHPAKVFMGDTGSLALGGAIAAVAVLTKTELLLVIIGGVFVVEALSVILQVLSFKLRGKRIFRMSPIHHHFELEGWSEWKVVTVFWLAGFCLAGIGIYLEVFA
ncbi:Phospho-N-acetylmuramoyl-pentapeptide-transferase [Caldalkalibacillus thermarum TA2.A1]|uniref:Phospho-N-acetylmuramoyl-pentapeptide-transferase n=1 Tax=Caldalkalibacillus thermarum (strain TA2.A1) TaxID=986075 RepID=F5L8Z7_CALTT|nr:phospho-N-acetylmuramoyl-pentapeptide-transferase [Caldalkalibacillus thermarum]EGL82171.1 Phospho-N-acetylmuramoyl-pentapeptide-transferase [Caldalkalibacillus thermarum TA2.A1]QZT33115.1 phospho-N-acetylmuramoyl-pentapeptide-transferase [Caldalkalibacillus thermarum TA2.A1]